ncbi:2OG-Fe dioxygenase family protein [Kitasatospora kifunensis]|uniref:2OG-Fe dioxygenase family protein n=1 Tax=Kitasatospora kifunensis TaxID=58351 RepID=A0A7W7R9N6_KITKI|nr:2OG-Fe dioxygenase family protein [Kitasatospora kifunensis]MBB4928022.1 hypothetical protein [Kitasatospora kifunensis]
MAVAGFARYRRKEVLEGVGDHYTDTQFEQIRRSFADLPADPYAEGSNRYRRYGGAVYLPWERSLTWLPASSHPRLGPVTEFYQGEYNPEYSGTRRYFSAIATEILENPLLREIVLFDAAQMLWLKDFGNGPLFVGVHFVKLAVDDLGDVAVSSPDALHQDGEPFSFVHLISRDNVVGGVNVIAPPRCAGLRPEEVTRDLLHAEFTLEDPLDSFGVYDPLVSHYVSSVGRGNEPRGGERSVLLVGFTPYVPHVK